MPDVPSIPPPGSGPSGIKSTSGTDVFRRGQETNHVETKPIARDRVELSEHAQFLDQLRGATEDVSLERIASIRSAIEHGDYESEEKVEIALERLMQDLK